jgi:hypothetical protein
VRHEIRVPIGVDDFRMLREQRLTYVDKPHLVCEILDKAGAQVLLLPRPCRFGKTLNLSMLRCFFGQREEDLSSLFEGLRVFQAGEPSTRQRGGWRRRRGAEFGVAHRSGGVDKGTRDKIGT